MTRAACCLAVATLIAGGQSPPSHPRFATTIDLVRFEVMVDVNDEAVTGLTAGDFSITDAGLPVGDVSVREFADEPFDMVLVVQPFASHSGEQVTLFERTARTLFGAIRTSDRFGVVLAAQPPVRSRALADGPVPFDRQALAGTPHAVLFDALGAALTEFDDNDRRKIVLVVADGVDRLSALAEDMLAPLASRSQPKVVFLGVSPTLLDALKFRSTGSGDDRKTELIGARFKNSFPGEALRAVAENTGGRIVDLRDLAPETAVTRLIARLRSGYILTFPSPTTKGWHPVSVKVNKRGATVATRAGYFVG
jgi:hypothetical protein